MTSDISVIIPAYNLERYVDVAIESALSQSVPPCGVIVVDNGSTDGTAARLAAWGERITVETLMPNQGVSRARNHGASIAEGNWFLFLDADDSLLPGALEHLAEAAQNSRAGVIFGKILQYDEDTGEIAYRDYLGCIGEPPVPAGMNFWRSCIATPGAAIIRRSVHEEIGGFAKPWQPTEDRDYWMKCGAVSAFEHCDHDVVRKLRRAGSMRVFNNRAILWGMRVQFEYLDLCRERKIDTDFLEFDANHVAGHALERAGRAGDWQSIRDIHQWCHQQSIQVPALRWVGLKLWWHDIFQRKMDGEKAPGQSA